MIVVLIPAIAQLATQISTNFDDWLLQLRDWSQSTFGFPVPSEEVAADAGQAGDLIGTYIDQPLGAVLGFASAGVSLVFNLATMAMFTFYFTADMPRIQRAVLRLLTPRQQERVGWTWDTAIVQTGGYFYSRMLLMLINGLGFFVTMAFVGVPVGFALALAVFGSFVSVFIPAVGTYIGGAVPCLVTLAVAGWVPALIVLGYVLVYQQVENYWLSPRISADTMSINGGLAFGAAIAGGAIAGPLGAFVALPVAALITSSISNYARSYELVYDSQLDDDDP
ncbi:AI-2E family transporter [Salsipaludibacter albus]|uniref:AI-2E family transporter n=1 Tax=Salsipaludibacter albus TaxID=2849650 RepID=UPI001EE44A51|nr:AI-2E family transporter [Salsipaludibacter albus]MBY5162513.1 AI-2E family transporter [Salsipaludibacter albus]